MRKEREEKKKKKEEDVAKQEELNKKIALEKIEKAKRSKFNQLRFI